MCKGHFTNKQSDEEGNTMASITNNYIYAVKAKKGAEKKIPVFGKKKIEECRKLLAKYSDKK